MERSRSRGKEGNRSQGHWEGHPPCGCSCSFVSCALHDRTCAHPRESRKSATAVLGVRLYDMPAWHMLLNSGIGL